MSKRKIRMGAVMLLTGILLLSVLTGAAVRTDGRSYSYEDAEMISKVVWGEARGLDATQQAAVVWCILNRVDNDEFPNSIQAVVTQRNQFSGYCSNNPVDADIFALVSDVLARWTIEPGCLGGVGRVLPENYYFFHGNGTENLYRIGYWDKETWDWSLPTPYTDYPT